MPDTDQHPGTSTAHKIGVAAGVASILSLVVAGVSFVYDRLDNRATSTAAPAPAASAPAAPAATTTPPASAPAADSYVLAHDIARWTIPAPRSSCGRTYADLDGDQPRARVNSDDESGDELLYWHCSPVGLRPQNALAVGRAGKKRPATAAECAATAQQDAVAANIEPGDLTVREDAFCVITDQENVAWLNLVAKETASNSDPNLVFRLVVWHRAPAAD
jgi:hypothetical protein